MNNSRYSSRRSWYLRKEKDAINERIEKDVFAYYLFNSLLIILKRKKQKKEIEKTNGIYYSKHDQWSQCENGQIN